MKSNKGFDRLSGTYDLMVKLVFGKTIRKAQITLIEKVVNKRKWLILGGGTGWVLEEIFKVHPNIEITYVEASQKMIDRTKKRDLKGHVDYVIGSADQLPPNRNYNVILTPFFWDMFSTTSALKIKATIEQKLENDAIWLLADFKNTDIWWQHMLMNIMYWFFRVTCNIEASKLPDFTKIFNKEKHMVSFHASFYKGMIASTVYRLNK